MLEQKRIPKHAILRKTFIGGLLSSRVGFMAPWGSIGVIEPS